MGRGLAFIIGCAFACPWAAAAQTHDAAELEEEARLHFELGERAYNRGEFAEASVHFEEAYRLSQRTPLLYNLYLSYRDAQDQPRAADSLRRYLAAAGDIPNRARLEQTLRQLEAELAQTAPGDAPSSEAPIPTGSIVVLGAGAALAIGSIITGALALARNDELSAACPANRCSSEDARAIQADVDVLSTATDVLWPIGVAAFVAGAVWLVIELALAPRTSAQLSCGATGCTARLGGSFQ